MGNRGSKLVNMILHLFMRGRSTVKEQRVNSNYKKIELFLLRRTLTGLEINRSINTQFKFINKSIKSYSTSVRFTEDTLHNKVEGAEGMAWFLCGLVDGEGCFMISITKSAKNKLG